MASPSCPSARLDSPLAVADHPARKGSCSRSESECRAIATAPGALLVEWLLGVNRVLTLSAVDRGYLRLIRWAKGPIGSHRETAADRHSLPPYSPPDAAQAPRPISRALMLAARVDDSRTAYRLWRLRRLYLRRGLLVRLEVASATADAIVAAEM